MAPGILDNDLFRIQTLQHVMRMTRTWDSTMSMIPKGGDTIWGDLDWSPEESYVPRKRKQGNNDSQTAEGNDIGTLDSQERVIHYGRIISFGKDVAEAPSSDIERIDFKASFFVPLETSSLKNVFCKPFFKIVFLKYS